MFLAIDKRTDTVVGIMTLNDSQLNQLYIHSNFQRMDVGSGLLNMAKELSRGKLQLFTFEINKKAQTFYEKRNFKVIGRGSENEENLPDIEYEWIESIAA